MFSLLHKLQRTNIAREGIALLLAFAIAEFFYKFHSFTLECAAFLATWYAIGFVTVKLFPSTPDAARQGGRGEA